MKTWIVKVEGDIPYEFTATTRAKAKMKAFRAFRAARGGSFLRFAKTLEYIRVKK